MEIDSNPQCTEDDWEKELQPKQQKYQNQYQMMSWVTEFAGEQKRKYKNHKNNQLYCWGFV